jgi:hypothetical protein
MSFFLFFTLLYLSRLLSRTLHNVFQAILNKNTQFLNSKVSVRRFDSFGFVKSVKIAYNNDLASRSGTSLGRSTPRATKNRYEDDDDDDIQVMKSGSSGDGSLSSRASKYSPNSKSNGKETFQWYSMSIPSIDPRESVKVR